MPGARVRWEKPEGAGPNIREAREARGVTFAECASRLAIEPERLERLEAGQVEPERAEVQRAVFAFKFPPAFFTSPERRRGYSHEGFIDGAGIKPCSTCGYVADYLCDYPTGGRKTCDLALCPDHAHEVAPDRHLCPIHRTQVDNGVDGGQSMTTMKADTCRSCGATICWCWTETGARMPLDPEPMEPDPAGNACMLVPESGGARKLGPMEIAVHDVNDGHLYTPHHITCPQGRQWKGARRQSVY